MAANGQGDPDRKREALDLAEFTRRQPWWRKLFGPESGPSAEKYSAATQLAVGGVTGWCTGLVFRKVGKLAATALGGGFFLLQLASHTGYIRVDWQRLEKDVKKAKAQLKIHRGRQMPTEVGSKAEEIQVCTCAACSHQKRALAHNARLQATIHETAGPKFLT